MSPGHRNRIIPTSSAILISYLASITHATFTNDFSAYPAAARSCLDSAAAASGCTGNTVTEMNTCLCGNGGNFVLATSKCVGKEAKDKLDDVYEMLLTSCTDSKTPLGISQAQFLDPDDDDETKSTASSSSTSQSSSTTLYTSTTAPPTEVPEYSTTSTTTSLTTYKSVAPGGVTVTVTRGVETVQTGTASGKQGSNSEGDQSTTGDEGPSHTALAAGLAGGLAILLGVLAFFCYRRRKQRKERKGQVGAGGKFAALSSATSLTTMSASPPQGQATTAYHGVNDRRPDTANTMNMAVGTPGWNRQQQGPQSPQHWQNNNSPGHYGQQAGTWPSPVANGDGVTGTWGVSPVSQYRPNSSRGPEPSPHTETWNAHAAEMAAAPVPAPHPSHPSNNGYSPVFELPGDQIQAVEADSTPVGQAQPVVQPPSRSIQSTPAQMQAQPAQPAPAHHGMPRQIDDALQISRVELPPPRYSGPSSPDWVSEDKKFG